MSKDFTKWKCTHVDDPNKDGTYIDGDNIEEDAKEFLRSIGVKEGSIDTFYNWGTGLYRERDQGRTFGAIEQFMSTRFNVLHVHRDHREDWGDDAGWIAVVSEKNGKYLLHILFITYNLDLHTIVFDEEELKTKFADDEGAFVDCKVFDTLDEVQAEIDKFMGYVEKALVDKNEEWYDLWEDEDMEMIEERLGVKFTPLEIDWMRALTNVYGKLDDDWYFETDKEAMLNLTQSEYTPNFTSD